MTTQPIQIDDYDIDIIVTGYPGKSVCHGSLGWSTIVLVRHGDRNALIDVGSFAQRFLIIERLAERDLAPGDVSDVLLSHSHFDHSVNWTLFRDARIVIGAHELAWSLQEPWGETPVPELYVRELAGWPTLHEATDGEEVFPGITARVAPGHTPGHMVYVLEGTGQDVIFTGDAAKNRAELLSRSADMTYDADVSRASIEAIWEIWRRRPGNIVVPGHDLPMTQEDGVTRYLGSREAGVRSWLGDDLESTTVFELSVAR